MSHLIENANGMEYLCVWLDQVFDVTALRQKIATAKVSVFARDYTHSLFVDSCDYSYPYLNKS